MYTSQPTEISHECSWLKKDEQTAYISYCTDIFNLADFICIRKTDGKPFLVQCKTTGNLEAINQKAKYSLFNKYKQLGNSLGFIALKPTKTKGDKTRIEYLIL